MIKRSITENLQEYLKLFPAVGLVGARQVGKTTLAQSIADQIDKPIRYFDLERLEDYRMLSSDPGFFLSQFKDELVVIDEVQRMPSIFTALRSLIDTYRIPGRFLLLGSASPLLMRNTAESLAGRIGYITLSPLHLSELEQDQVTMGKHWWRGGFPDSWLAQTDHASIEWRENFLRTYVERDLQFLGLNTDPVQFRIFLQMLASVQGNLWNAESLGRSLGISGNTVKHYLHFLEISFFVRMLQPYFANIGKRLVKSPKVYIQDTGLLHSLLNIRNQADLPIHTSAGASWESYAMMQILGKLPEGISPYFFRTSDGTETDLVLVDGLVPIASIELKLGSISNPGKGFHNTIKALKTKHNYVITHSGDDYAIRENIHTMSLLNFVHQLPAIVDK